MKPIKKKGSIKFKPNVTTLSINARQAIDYLFPGISHSRLPEDFFTNHERYRKPGFENGANSLIYRLHQYDQSRKMSQYPHNDGIESRVKINYKGSGQK